MSTRANIIIKDNYSKLFFYRHSDGYPEGTLPSLNVFLDRVKQGKIRDNVSQAAGWLIAIGMEEQYYSWKVGSYEPTTGIHGDIEYLYIIDLESKTITVHESNFKKWE